MRSLGLLSPPRGTPQAMQSDAITAPASPRDQKQCPEPKGSRAPELQGSRPLYQARSLLKTLSHQGLYAKKILLHDTKILYTKALLGRYYDKTLLHQDLFPSRLPSWVVKHQDSLVNAQTVLYTRGALHTVLAPSAPSATPHPWCRPSALGRSSSSGTSGVDRVTL